MEAVLDALGVDADTRNAHSVVEGSPGQGFEGRLTFSLALVKAAA